MRFMEKLARFMYGRYGSDALNLTLLITGIIWSTVWGWTPYRWVSAFSWLFLALVIYRMLSRDLYRRRRENDTFLRLTRPIADFFRDLVERLRDRDHRRFRCPDCKQVCRVPKGRGRIRIRCPKCGTSFVKDTGRAKPSRS